MTIEEAQRANDLVEVLKYELATAETIIADIRLLVQEYQDFLAGQIKELEKRDE